MKTTAIVIACIVFYLLFAKAVGTFLYEQGR